MKIVPIQNYNIQSFLGNTYKSDQQPQAITAANTTNLRPAAIGHLSYYQIEQNCSTSDFQIKRLENMPCASCGNIMVTNRQLDNFVGKTKSAKGEELAEALKSNYKIYRPIEKLVVDSLLDLIPKKTNKPLLELVKILNKTHVLELEQAQNIILDEMESSNKGFSEKESIRIRNLISRSRQDIEYSSKLKEPFKRKAFINDVLYLGQTISNKQAYRKIVEIAESLPTSTNNLSAFYAKYSRRSSQEIAFRLLAPSLSTAEHIKPQHNNGEDKISNYLAECAHCNSRRGCMSFAAWLKMQPDMPQNALKYFEEVEKRLEKGELSREYANYSIRAIKTLKKESGGLISVALQPKTYS